MFVSHPAGLLQVCWISLQVLVGGVCILVKLGAPGQSTQNAFRIPVLSLSHSMTGCPPAALHVSFCLVWFHFSLFYNMQQYHTSTLISASSAVCMLLLLSRPESRSWYLRCSFNLRWPFTLYKVAYLRSFYSDLSWLYTIIFIESHRCLISTQQKYHLKKLRISESYHILSTFKNKEKPE